jgi:hypothetical protein
MGLRAELGNDALRRRCTLSALPSTPARQRMSTKVGVLGRGELVSAPVRGGVERNQSQDRRRTIAGRIAADFCGEETWV